MGDEMFQQATPASAVPEIPAGKGKAPSKSSPATKPAATAANAAATGKTGKLQDAAQLAMSAPATVTLTGLDTPAHSAMLLAFRKACDDIHSQINARARILKGEFQAALLEEEANAARWQDCLKWMSTPLC